MTITQVENLARSKGLITTCDAGLKTETVDSAGYYECREGHMHHVTYVAMSARHSQKGFEHNFQRAWNLAYEEQFNDINVELGNREDGDVMIEGLRRRGFDLQDNII